MISAEERAYELAVERVEEARAAGASAISFDSEEYRELTRIPEGLDRVVGLGLLNFNKTKISDLSPIAGLTWLRLLHLNQTRVSDLSPIAGLTGLESLTLEHTGVSDLSPIAGLTWLGFLALAHTEVSDLRPLVHLNQLAEGDFGGLWFSDTPAARLDDTLGRLAQIEDTKQRAKEVLAYLKTLPPWPEPLPWLEPIEGSIKVAAPSHSLDRQQPWAKAQKEIAVLAGKIAALEDQRVPNSNVLTQLADQEVELGRKLASQADRIEAEEGKVRRAAEAMDALRKRLDEFAIETEDKIAKAQEEYKRSMESAANAFTEGNRIKEPVKLWEEKEAEHRKAMSWRGVWFGASVAISMLAACGLLYGLFQLGSQVDTLFTPIGCDKAKPETCAGFTMRGFLATGSVFTIFTLLFWFARLQMKLFLAERHLALDARERRAFAQTYIGLLKEDPTTGTSAQATEQHAMVYSALFRPSSDGTVKEEGGLDPAITAAVSKLLTK